MSDTLRKIAVIGGSRIPFCRSNSIYSEKTNLDMLAAALQGVVNRFSLDGKQLDEVVAGAVTSTEPLIMLTGPGPASKKALSQAGMTVGDIDLFEVNEAFAAVPMRFMRDVGIDSLDNVNVNGGAIALGHPLGGTGACLLGTALDELERRQLATALITLCVGGGMGIATIIERVN